MRSLLLALLVSIVNLQTLSAVQPVELKTLHSASVGRPGMTVRFLALVVQDVRNRQLCFDWVADRASGSGCVSLEGDKAATTYWRDITFRTSGEFIVNARLERNDGHTLLSNIVVIRVLEIGGE